jgi:nitrate reductase (NAD(P)H)
MQTCVDKLRVTKSEWILDPHEKDQRSNKRARDDLKDPRRPKEQEESLEQIQNPDSWIKRDPNLIRLTGPLPMNAEPPMNLFMKDFITPSSLHYIRSHGSVPKLEWETHKFVIDGLVDNPREFTMDELANLPSVDILNTMVCVANRRKEINTIRHTRGFNWGPGALSTAVWTGVKLADLLKLVGAHNDANFVCLEGADNLAHGHWGTSIPFYKAVDPLNDILVAYKMNGERLHPDHGFPVRVVVPGIIGGRSVKWLSKITVSKEDSKNYYHYYDIKVLPPQVDFSSADNAGWWFKNEYAVYEVNINSVITSPAQEEYISSSDKTYTVRGYAYTGGGRRVTRVEISLDGGQTWDLANIKYPTTSDVKERKPEEKESTINVDDNQGFGHIEERIGQRLQTNEEHLAHLERQTAREGQDQTKQEKFAHRGKWWTCIFWDIDVDVWKILRSEEIIVRAWDESHNMQPEHPTWNVLGTMNNCWYRVKIEVELDSENPYISFRHPVLPGSGMGGWMKEG